ncbi:MAG TPA: ABC transporter ATP-binding protein, partial [bacterium]|nr:ABC transporter ATP-binding protein [bacterium]
MKRREYLLRDITWHVYPGQHWVMLGPNGSGKTTLLNTLTAYFPPTTGTVTVDGKEFGRYDWRELRKRIGIVSSAVKRKIHRPVTARDMVLSGKDARLNFTGDVTEDDRRRADGILEQLHCTHLRDRLWPQLSQGERQRVMIGRALMADLCLLILDEPCAGLDPVARERFLVFIEDLAQSVHSPTMVFVTHHVEEIMPTFTHVLLLRSGTILASGPKQDVLNSAVLSETFDASITLRQQNF